MSAAPACIDPDCPVYRCQSCGNDICPDRQPSPGEPDVCAACWSLEDDGAVAP